jgi:hypothetical protein
MEPIFTLPYSEWVVAEELAKLLPAGDGYSIFVPLSRQEKGVDILITRRDHRKTHAVTVQVKFSRTYKQPDSRGHEFETWFNNFEVPEQADFLVLVSLYPTDQANRSKVPFRWKPLVLLFERKEMQAFVASVKTRRGTRDKMFGFGFSDSGCVIQTRGDQQRRQLDFTAHVLAQKLPVLTQRLYKD